MEQVSTKKQIEVKDLEDVHEGNGIWPYRVVEDDRITYFQLKATALNYQDTTDSGQFEFYVLPRWYSV